MRKNEYQAFASSFLDLWQEQIARAMSDTDFLQAIMENMQEMQAGVFGYDPAHKPISTLPMHLSLSLMNWMICNGALQRQNEKSPSSKPPSNGLKAAANLPLPASQLLSELQKLQQSLPLNPRANRKNPPLKSQRAKPQPNASARSNAADPFAILHSGEFGRALREESHRRALQMLEGVQQYQQQEIEVSHAPSRIIWRKANACLRDYGGGKQAPAIMCIPSLINRHTILDLHPERSMVRFLRQQGFRVLTLDWGEPGSRERRYGMGEYVSYLLIDALTHLRRAHHGALHLLGYCMGGMLALAGAQLRPNEIDRLILLATPWKSVPHPAHDGMDWSRLRTQIKQMDTVPPMITQTLFHLLDPWHFQEKFSRFNELSPAEKTHFAHLEQWLNDGVPLSRYVAEECFVNWPQQDYFAQGKWRIGGQRIDPARIDMPCFIATPMQDRIVPPESSEPLLGALADCKHIAPDCGHLGMVVGSRAKQQLWQPLSRWLKSV